MPPSCPTTASGTGKARLEAAEIFRRFGPSFQARHRLPPQHGRVLRHLIACRTEALGGHVDWCEHCGHTVKTYNSCRDRHCPSCQGAQQLRWIARREKRLVATHHFHVVFTMPEELRPLARTSPEVVYALMFAAARDTLLELAKDRWDAVPGVTAVLHTWTRQMTLHPHVHCIVTGGGLDTDDGWVASRKNFLFPVRVMGALFRGKFLAGLERARRAGKLRFTGSAAELANPGLFDDLVRRLRRTSWVVYAKRPFGGPEQVLRYLGRYTHRVAISSSRLVAIDEHQIVFRTHGERTCRLSPDELLRRFLLHVLPKGFNKIRHYGLYASSNVARRLLVAQEVVAHLCRAERRRSTPVEVPSPPPRPTTCPVCQVGRWRRSTLPPARAPPRAGP